MATANKVINTPEDINVIPIIFSIDILSFTNINNSTINNVINKYTIYIINLLLEILLYHKENMKYPAGQLFLFLITLIMKTILPRLSSDRQSVI